MLHARGRRRFRLWMDYLMKRVDRAFEKAKVEQLTAQLQLRSEQLQLMCRCRRVQDSGLGFRISARGRGFGSHHRQSKFEGAYTRIRDEYIWLYHA